MGDHESPASSSAGTRGSCNIDSDGVVNQRQPMIATPLEHYQRATRSRLAPAPSIRGSGWVTEIRERQRPSLDTSARFLSRFQPAAPTDQSPSLHYPRQTAGSARTIINPIPPAGDCASNYRSYYREQLGSPSATGRVLVRAQGLKTHQARHFERQTPADDWRKNISGENTVTGASR